MLNRNPCDLARLALVFLCGSLLGCGSGPEPGTGVTAIEADPGLGPGDAVRIAVWREPDLSGTFGIDDRGIVTLPLLGDREVAGMDAPALRNQLLTDYREYLQNPSIQVTVLRRVNILGAVNQPGLYTVDATISLSEALGMAGGIGPTGDADDIRLARSGRVIHGNLDRAAVLGSIDVRSGDQIVVGEKGWFERNPGALIGSLIGAVAGVTVALIR